MGFAVTTAASLALAVTGVSAVADAQEFELGGISFSEIDRLSSRPDGISYVTSGSRDLDGHFLWRNAQTRYVGNDFAALAGEDYQRRYRSLVGRANASRAAWPPESRWSMLSQPGSDLIQDFWDEFRCANYDDDVLPRCPAEFATNPNIREFAIFLMAFTNVYGFQAVYAGEAGLDGTAAMLSEIYPSADVVLRTDNSGGVPQRRLHADLPNQRLYFSGPSTYSMRWGHSEPSFTLTVIKTGDPFDQQVREAATVILDQFEAHIVARETARERSRDARNNARPREF